MMTISNIMSHMGVFMTKNRNHKLELYLIPLSRRWIIFGGYWRRENISKLLTSQVLCLNWPHLTASFWTLTRLVDRFTREKGVFANTWIVIVSICTFYSLYFMRYNTSALILSSDETNWTGITLQLEQQNQLNASKTNIFIQEGSILNWEDITWNERNTFWL